MIGRRNKSSADQLKKITSEGRVCVTFDISISFMPTAVDPDRYVMTINNRDFIIRSDDFSDVMLTIGHYVKERYTCKKH
jgi:hypothetical protein